MKQACPARLRARRGQRVGAEAMVRGALALSGLFALGPAAQAVSPVTAPVPNAITSPATNLPAPGAPGKPMAALVPAVQGALARQVQAGGWNTVAVGVIDGERTAVQGFGSTAGRAVDGDTLYAIGSVTKTFTAYLLADAVQRGETTLEQDAFPLLGLVAGGPGLVELATHTSGLPRLPVNMQPARMDNPYAGYGPKQLADGLRDWQRPAQAASYSYSNLGYGLLGQALARRAGTSYADLVRQRITSPLGMGDTTQQPSAADAGRTAPGHGADGQAVNAWEFDALAGAGALHSSVHDLLRYVAAAMRAQQGTAWRLQQQVTRTGPDARTRIALGWHRSTLPDGRVMVWHNGQTGGHASFVGWIEGGSRAVVVLANTSRLVDGLAVQLLVNRGPILDGAP